MTWTENAIGLARGAAQGDGDGDALEELLEVLRPRIIRSVRLIVGPGRPEAEDVAQEALADIYRGIGALRSPEAVVSWAFRIASRRAVRASRRERLLRLFVPLDETDGQEPTTVTGTPLENLALRQAFNRLPARMRAVAVLRLYVGFSEEAAAETLGCSVGTVKSQLHEARKRLAASIKEWQ